MMMKKMTTKLFSIFCILSFLAGPTPAFATVDQVKLYKSNFGDKPKCTTCHVDKIPKKDDGKHELNEYGQKLKEAKTQEVPDDETYKTVGKNEKADLVEA